MKIRTRKPRAAKRKYTGVKTASFEPGNFFDFAALRMKAKTAGAKHESQEPPSDVNDIVPNPPGYDRSCLRDMEVFLNNCVNLAEQVEDRRAAKIVKLLREARDRATRLRDSLRAD